MSCHNPTQVITTVMLTEGDNPHWTVQEMPNGQVLLQSCDVNIGIMGTPRQLATMFKRQSDALAHHVIQPTTEVPVHVN